MLFSLCPFNVGMQAKAPIGDFILHFCFCLMQFLDQLLAYWLTAMTERRLWLVPEEQLTAAW